MTQARIIAEWVCGLKFSDIPQRVVEKAKYQCLSVLAAVFPGSRSHAGEMIYKTIVNAAQPGPCTVIPFGSSATAEQAAFAHSAFSISYDFDDYLFMGHPCHSAVTVPLALCQLMKLGGREFILAQVIANEVEGRLGAAVLMGPHNGQAWSFIHAIGTACAAAKLMNLGPEKTENAIGIALYQPNYLLFPGFMGPDTKLLTAGIPLSAGLLAARLASNGFSGPSEIIEDPQGFLRHFSFIPFEGMLSGWGRSWVTDTLCFKPYPGCAYIDSTVDALLMIMKEFQDKNRRPLKPSDVKNIHVRTTLLTIGMDGLSKKQMKEDKLTPVIVNFSIPLSVAITIIAGKLTSKEMARDFLDESRKEIVELSRKVSLSLDWGMSFGIAGSLMEAGILKVISKGLSLRDLVRVRRRLREGAGGELPLKPSSLIGLLLKLFTPEGRALRRIIAGALRSFASFSRENYNLGDADFTRLSFPFSAEVTLHTASGERFSFRQDIPLGALGRPLEETKALVREKFRREAGDFLGNKTEEVMNMVLEMESLKDISPLVSACCP